MDYFNKKLDKIQVRFFPPGIILEFKDNLGIVENKTIDLLKNALRLQNAGCFAIVLEMLRYTEQYVWWLITDVIAVAQYAIKKDPVYTICDPIP